MARVLVLEGDTFARDLYCGFLRSEGYKVRGEPDTALALAALEKEPADVLVAQVGATEPYSGMLLAEARRRAPGVDLIALVERSSADGAARALRDGACEYLLKPVTQAAQMSSAPWPGAGSSRMLLRRMFPVEPSWMFTAQRASLAIRTVLLMTRLLVDGAPPSIW